MRNYMKGLLLRLLMYILCVFLLTVSFYTLIVTPFKFSFKGGSLPLIAIIAIVLVYLVVDIILLFRKKIN